MRSFKKLFVVTGIATSILVTFGLLKRPDSIYMNQPEEQNPMQGKMVHFVQNDDEQANADGLKGHLEAYSESMHTDSFYEGVIKRIIDIVFSLAGILLLSPLFAVVSIAIAVDDPGPVLFTQKRVGKNKQYFKLHKFRSMKMNTPHNVPTHMLENPNQYITKIGHFMRKTSIDELPQLWDIFIGNMSIIGPRPALWNQDVLVAERDKYKANDVKPGLTGWAQINGRDELEIPVKAKLDGEYVKRLSFSFDFKCFVETIISVAKGSGVVEGGTGEMTKRI